MGELRELYHDTRERALSLVDGIDESGLETTVPAAPEWRIHDLLSHVTGVAADVVAGNLDGVATDPWTAAQVAARRDMSGPELAAEWHRVGALVDEMIDAFPLSPARQLIFDTVTHEHDLRGALDSPGSRDSAAVGVAAEWALAFVDLARAGAGAGPLRVETEAGALSASPAEPAAVLRTSRFELLRAMSGRRSAAQLAAYQWSGDARPELVVLGIFVPRATDLVE